MRWLRSVSTPRPLICTHPMIDAGLDDLFFHVVRDDIFEFFYEYGPLGVGTDDGHATLEHVEEFWRFVKAVAAEEYAEGGMSLGFGVTPLDAFFFNFNVSGHVRLLLIWEVWNHRLLRKSDSGERQVLRSAVPATI